MRGMSGLYYNFRVNNEFYSGHTLNIDDYLVGDSIDVLYIKQLPSINYDYKYISNNYNTSILKKF